MMRQGSFLDYKIITEKKVSKQLKKMDQHIAKEVKKWLKTLNISKEPRGEGTALSANLKGLWRYRNDSLQIRLVVIINDKLSRVKVVGLEDRKKVYNAIKADYYQNKLKEEKKYTKSKGISLLKAKVFLWVTKI